jgi:hypothetical protein
MCYLCASIAPIHTEQPTLVTGLSDMRLLLRAPGRQSTTYEDSLYIHNLCTYPVWRCAPGGPASHAPHPPPLQAALPILCTPAAPLPTPHAPTLDAPIENLVHTYPPAMTSGHPQAGPYSIYNRAVKRQRHVTHTNHAHIPNLLCDTPPPRAARWRACYGRVWEQAARLRL